MGLNIEISGLSFAFGGNGHRLRDVSIDVEEGELCCLLGPNGAGKTTLIRCVLGLLEPDAGSVRVAGREVAGLSARQLARVVAYVPQSTVTVFPFTTLDIAVMGRTPHLDFTSAPSSSDRRIAQDALDVLGIGDLAQRAFSQLSGGERQLAMLARALVQEAQVLILDEPTSALDYGNEVRILDVVGELVTTGRSVLMTTHQPNHALLWGHQAVLMSDGSVVASGPAGDVITAERLSALYGVPIAITRVPAGSPGATQLVCHPEVASSRLRSASTHVPRSSDEVDVHAL